MSSKLFLETVRSEGLAHLSYVVGHQGRAAVIDPRRDIDVYLDIARGYGAAVAHIFETHRKRGLRERRLRSPFPAHRRAGISRQSLGL